MKLNPDCIRDILLQMEQVSYGDNISPKQLHNELTNYTTDEIDYALIKMHEAGFINAKIKQFIDGEISIELYDISYNGHQFLENVRSSKVWNVTKKVATDIGSSSVQAITQIATGVITEIIKQTIFPLS